MFLRVFSLYLSLFPSGLSFQASRVDIDILFTAVFHILIACLSMTAPRRLPARHFRAPTTLTVFAFADFAAHDFLSLFIAFPFFASSSVFTASSGEMRPRVSSFSDVNDFQIE